ncbi:MAG: hypothetical protein QF755_05200 [Candidatus Peribacteraceae bacterium]|nr:hypothetical protein [Candidatus Peribacteraceae bacterium]
MKDINAHTHWQFGNFSPNKESRFIYVDKPTKAPEVEKEVKEAMEQTKNLEQVQQQAGEKVKQAEGDVKKLGDKLKMLKDLQGRVNNAVATDSTEKVVFRSQEVLLKDIDATHLQEDVDKTKADITTAQEALKEEQEKSKEAVEKATEALDQALSKLSPKQQEAFKKLKAANEKAKNTPPGSAEGKNIIEAILALILEWIQSAGDKDKDKDKDKGAQSPGNTPPQGPENNNQTPPEKQEAPELKAVRKEIEDSDYRTVYDNAKDARDNAKTKLDTAENKLNNQENRERTLQSEVDDAQTALDAMDPSDANYATTKSDLETKKETLRNHQTRMDATKTDVEHFENEYQVNKAKVDLMDGAKEVAEKEAEEIDKGLKLVSAEIGASIDNPNEQALHDAINQITVEYKKNTLDDVQFTSNYTEAEWDKVKAVANEMGLNSAAFETNNEGVIKNPAAFTSELLAVAQSLDAGAEGQVATIKEMTDAGVDQSAAESAFEIRQKYGVEFKVNAGRVQVEGGAGNTKKAFLAFRKEGGVTGTSLDTNVIKAVEDHIKSALADITTPEGKAVVEAGFIPNTAKVHEQLVQLAQDPAMGGFKSMFTIDDAGVFYRPPTPDFKDKIVNSKLYEDRTLDPQILAMYS